MMRSEKKEFQFISDYNVIRVKYKSIGMFRWNKGMG